MYDPENYPKKLKDELISITYDKKYFNYMEMQLNELLSLFSKNVQHKLLFKELKDFLHIT